MAKCLDFPVSVGSLIKVLQWNTNYQSIYAIRFEKVLCVSPNQNQTNIDTLFWSTQTIKTRELGRTYFDITFLTTSEITRQYPGYRMANIAALMPTSSILEQRQPIALCQLPPIIRHHPLLQ